MPLDPPQGPFAFPVQTVNCRDLLWRQHALYAYIAKYDTLQAPSPAPRERS